MPRDIAWGKGHGFNDASEGDNNINKDRHLIEQEGARLGLNIKVDGESNKYGKHGLFKIRPKRHRIVARMVSWIETQLAAGNTVVMEGYSNGYNYWLKAIRTVCDPWMKLEPGQKIILIGVHPAGRVNPEYPACLSAIWLWITKSDWAVRFASYAAFFKLAPEWGRAGYLGYRGKDPRVTTRDLSDVARGHGGAYHDHNLKWGAREKVEWVAEQLGT